MPVDEMVVKWSMDSSNFNSGLTKLNKSMNLIKSEFKATDSNLKNFGNTTDQLKNKADYLNKTMELQKAKIDNLKTSYEKIKSETGENSDQTQKLGTQLNNAISYYNKLDAQLKNTNSELEKQSSRFIKIDTKLKNASDKIGSFGDKLVNIGSGFKKLTVGIGAVGAASAKSYKDVKEGQDNLIKATGATGESAKELEETYRNIGKNTPSDFASIGSALGEVNTRFGFTNEAAEKCTEQFLKFAKINNTDATTSVQLVSRAMGDAGINSNEYSSVLDKLSKAAQGSGISIDSLTQNLTKYGAPMRALGFDTNSSIAIFSGWEKAGVNTEIAFSGMKKAISTWSKEGKDSRQEFSKTLDEIAKCPDIASATTKSISVFGQKAGPDLADAIKGGRFNYKEFLDLVQNSAGTVDNTTNELKDGTEQSKIALNNLKISGSELGTTFLTMVAPKIQGLANKVKEGTRWFSGLNNSTKENIVTFGLYVAAIGPVIIFIGKFFKGISNIIKGMRDMAKFGKSSVKFIKDFGGALKSAASHALTFATNIAKSTVNLAKQGIELVVSKAKLIAHKVATIASTLATKAMELAQAGLNIVMSLNPIALVVLAIVGLVATIVILWNKSEAFREFVKKTWDTIKAKFEEFDNWLNSIFTTDWSTRFGVFGDILNGFFANCKNIWESIKQIFSGVIDFIAGVFTGDWSRAWEGVKNIFGGIFSGLGAIIKAPLNAVIALINGAIGGINDISIDIPDWVPGFGGSHFGTNIPKINYLYKGGIITSPTMINNNTVVGDAYKGLGRQAEAVIPLDSMYSNIRNIVKEEGSQQIFVEVHVDNNMDSRKLTDALTTKVTNTISKRQRLKRY